MHAFARAKVLFAAQVHFRDVLLRIVVN